MSADDWLDDIQSSDDGGASLFEDNFRRMVDESEVDSLNTETIKKQIGKIEDVELLAEAVEIDDREGMEEIYRARIGELNESEGSEEDEQEDEEAEEPDPDPEPEPETVVADSEDDEDESEDESGSQEPETDPEPDENGDEGDGSDTEEEIVPESDSAPDRVMPEVNVARLAPDAKSRDEAAEEEQERKLLVWGEQGTGKTHVAHSAPEPVAYIDTEGKADKIADKFDKEIYYWQPSEYGEAQAAMEQALDLLAAYRKEGVTGTIVVDSMSVMWEWAQVFHMEKTRPSAESLDEVSFESAFGKGEGDWQKIKGYHNTKFRDPIMESPYNVVLTAGRKEDYDFDGDSVDTRWMPDGEKHNVYAVDDVVRLRTNEDGKTVADLHKSADTRYSFINLVWPDWEGIYDAVRMVTEAEQTDEDVDVSDWPFGVVDGKPVAAGYAEGSEDDDDD